jgi:thiol-disulfide isomerase/thioredoxin
MAFTESNMIPIGTIAPDFELPDTVSGRVLKLDEVVGLHATVIMFLCNHCPYVLHINPEIERILHEYRPKGVGFVGISSNDAENYPQDGPEKMTEHALEVGYDFPYFFDETQEVARAYDAACTPDFYIFDAEKRLVYRGRLDLARPKNAEPLTGSELRIALDAALAGAPPIEKQWPSGGCNIKWKRTEH